jgi:hypothetical protein
MTSTDRQVRRRLRRRARGLVVATSVAWAGTVWLAARWATGTARDVVPRRVVGGDDPARCVRGHEHCGDGDHRPGLAGARLWFPGAPFRLGLGIASLAAILAVVADPGLAAGLGHVAMSM